MGWAPARGPHIRELFRCAARSERKSTFRLDEDELLRRSALAWGALSGEQIEQALRKKEELTRRGEPVSLAELFGKEGWIEGEQARTLMEITAHPQPHTSLTAQTPPGAAGPDGPGRPFGRHFIHEELGRGGMGIVWKAQLRLGCQPIFPELRAEGQVLSFGFLSR